MSASIDRLDTAILKQLQQDCSVTNQQLAERVGLSPPACLKRVRKLKQSGLIKQQVALLDQEQLGACLHMVVEVEMERDRYDLYQQFAKRVNAAEEVKQCYQVTGEVDFVLIVVVADMVAYEAFCRQVLYAEANMKNFRTLISMKRVKFDTSAVLPASD
ncbi:Lrp/AsnC family transcriptional regulator [Aestuariirhabdus sp. Z084]|uniref:Lrp/AsnC family transcriptional regulator n=1 Tax=Aestuariirhabdus haliotis TaxID=2918751 RepID=UPI00201B41A0|nr:Lrp/AsnC family transcriptional regulator [Aestuariirhabdus haliotis]MCL6415286.1 Lrp/AsnC family transcriptional regulator [Aestuariirhabdus haliotis]MCL6419546.1 Lrp/AsnC family transcriptional regulator [Aestuariirhabdus haliotis]